MMMVTACMLIEIKSWRIKFSFSKSFILKKRHSHSFWKSLFCWQSSSADWPAGTLGQRELHWVSRMGQEWICTDCVKSQSLAENVRSKYWSPKEKISTQPKHLPSSVWVDFGQAGPKTGGWCRRTSGDNDPPVGFGRHLITRKESHIWSAYSFSMLPVRIYYLYIWFGQNHNQVRHVWKDETHERPSK